MNNQSRENLVNDIENRLDDFFAEGQTEPSEPPGKVSMEKLKSVVLSIDWEITEACLDDLVEEAGALMPRFENDRLTIRCCACSALWAATCVNARRAPIRMP